MESIDDLYRERQLLVFREREISDTMLSLGKQLTAVRNERADLERKIAQHTLEESCKSAN